MNWETSKSEWKKREERTQFWYGLSLAGFAACIAASTFLGLVVASGMLE